ncbi:splicing factor U2AF 26 kDa subunit isoform X2 [Lynx rufus]|uniref:splicing factor U2AF 26 kDa subunit isoform X2 n=1 Tax=Lynx rufus TaxID=61384 RepID=UPI0011B06EC0|nr:splicing factor U2AF 26 kDa subunit isoform X2 [Lynx rufus]
MAEYLASIFGTEKDKVNCSFYFKIGACRHGDRCSRLHNKPTFSQTIVLLNLYRNPQNTAQTADGSHCHVSDVEVQEHYDNFFEEVFTELQEKYGEIEEMNVCDNLGDHLVGNVYVKVSAFPPIEPTGGGISVSPLKPHSLSFGVRRMQSGQWLNSITAGSMGRQCMLSCLLSPTSGSRAVGNTRWGNVPGVASATSCTFGPSPGIFDVSCMGEDPGADPKTSSEHHPRTSA